MNETQNSIVEWADATFGPVNYTPRAFSRLIEEVAELVKEVSMPVRDDAKTLNEIADAVIVAARLAHLSKSVITMGSDAQTGNRAPCPGQLVDDFLANEAVVAMCIAVEGFGMGRWSRSAVATFMEVCHGMAAVLDGDLQAAVNAKMAKNRARTWAPDGTGHGYHVKTA